MTETSPTTPENDIDSLDSLQAQPAPAMSPATRGALRRRLLLGGAATIPAIVTFGRGGRMQSFAVSNCLARTFDLQDIPLVGDATRADLIGLAQGSLVQELVTINGQTFLVNNAPGDANAERMDALILSAGVGFEVVEVFDTSGNQVVVGTEPLFSIVVVPPTTQAGCIASAGINVIADA
jgi:hypothetical protein